LDRILDAIKEKNMTIFESLVFVVLVQGTLKLNWIAVLISKFRVSVLGLWRPIDFVFLV